jgi:hypothetical protein
MSRLVPTLPGLTAGGLGRFRVYIGLMLLWLLARESPVAVPFELHRSYSPLSDNVPIHWLAASAAAWRGVQVAGMLAALCFTVGWWTRTAYVALVAALLLTRLAWLHSSGQHDWVCPLAILVSLLIVPWGDGFSVDQWRHPTVDPEARDPRYGFALFAPVFVMGLAFAAAAYAKLTIGGLAWVTTGAVRYHFVDDAETAATTWGLWIAAHPSVAVLVSAGAVALEATWIATAWLRSARLRLLAAAGALSLFLGFYAFQGALWVPWMMWLAACLPWDGWRSLPSTPLRRAPAVMAGAAIAIQVVASLTAIEIEPLMSPYQMYSGTYASTQEFETRRRRKLQRVEMKTEIGTIDVHGGAADSLADAIDGGPLNDDAREALDSACAAAAAATVDVRVARAKIDWSGTHVTRTWTRTDRSFACR